jgi:hypothetical protein
MATYRDTIKQKFLDLVEGTGEAYNVDSGVYDINIVPDESWGPEALAYAKELMEKLEQCIKTVLDDNDEYSELCIDCEFSPNVWYKTDSEGNKPWWVISISWYTDGEVDESDDDDAYSNPFEGILCVFEDTIE